MKKYFILLICLLGFSAQSYAVVTTQELTTNNYLKQQGYSPEMSRLVDLKKSQNAGTDMTYKNTDPAWYETNKCVKYVRKIFIYLDPGLDNGKFGTNVIKPSNSYDEL